jgi:hypothetical protein
MAENDGNQPPEGDQGQQEPHDVKRLRELAEEGAQTKAELAQLRRERAFERAGIDYESGPGALLFAHYDGENTIDAIKAEAEKFGVIKPPETPGAGGEGGEGAGGESGQQGNEDLGTGQRDALANGAPADENQKPNPYHVAEAAAKAVREKGGSSDAEAAAYLKVLAGAAASGDPRVIVQGPG